MRSELLNAILGELNGASADIHASAVISSDGLVMAAALPPGIEEDRLGAMSAALLALGGRTCQELGRGTMEQVLLKGDCGYVLMTHAGLDAVITAIAKPGANLALMLLDVKRAADQIAKVV